MKSAERPSDMTLSYLIYTVLVASVDSSFKEHRADASLCVETQLETACWKSRETNWRILEGFFFGGCIKCHKFIF